MALLEKDGNRPGGLNFFQIRTAYMEISALIGCSGYKEVMEAITKSLAIPTTAEEPGEMPPPDPLMPQDNRWATSSPHIFLA